MAIVPDTKDWTWVLERVCDECGFDASGVSRADLPDMIRENAQSWRDILRGTDLVLTVRPSVNRWSALEYACHVRDVFRIYDERLHLMLDEDDPTFPNWDQDVSAVEDRYNEQDPRRVAEELVDAAGVLADDFAGLRPEDWERPGSRSDGAHFVIDTFARYMIHDPVHHLVDVERGFAALDAASDGT